MAAVEDEMWYFRALHRHIERELIAALRELGGAATAVGSSASSPAREADGLSARILDAGCGTGGLIRRLESAHPAWRWTGVDLEPLACELARARGGRAEIREASVGALPFAAGSFDAVVAADVLYHLDDDVTALRECARVLRSGGRIVINVPAHRWLWSYHDVAVHGRRRYVRRDLADKIAAAGFRVERMTHWNTLPLPLVFVRRKLLPAPRSGSDVRLYPRPIESAFRVLMAIERAGLGVLRSFPLGSSILAVGTKTATAMIAEGSDATRAGGGCSMSPNG